LQLSGPSTSAEVAQIDTIVLHRDVGMGTNSFMLDGNVSTPYGSLGTEMNPLTIDAGALNLPAPAVYQSDALILSDPPFMNLSYAGDAYLESLGQTIALLPLFCAPRESPVATNPYGMFVPQTTIAGGTPVPYRFVVRRPLSYRVPQ
jgi:hypothetical protein